jgi:hypothetical protein
MEDLERLSEELTELGDELGEAEESLREVAKLREKIIAVAKRVDELSEDLADDVQNARSEGYESGKMDGEAEGYDQGMEDAAERYHLEAAYWHGRAACIQLTAYGRNPYRTCPALWAPELVEQLAKRWDDGYAEERRAERERDWLRLRIA